MTETVIIYRFADLVILAVIALTAYGMYKATRGKRKKYEYRTDRTN